MEAITINYAHIGKSLSNLIIYRRFLNDEIIQKLQELLTTEEKSHISYQVTAELIAAAEKLHLSGNLLHSYIIYLIAQDSNIFSTLVEKNGSTGLSLLRAVVHDMIIIKELLTTRFDPLLDTGLINDFVPSAPCSSGSFLSLYKSITTAITGNFPPEQLADIVTEHYRQFGYGEVANFKAFRWQEDIGLTGIEHFDPVSLDDIVGYEKQKDMLTANTKAFLANKPANNVLLIGARGTGKSSSVKALVNDYFPRGLRLVEITKHQLCILPKIMDQLRNRGKKFIIFLDDLSFEEFEVEYKYLKSIIEGGVEAKPANVLIYATSNRRHLIKENWSDREGSNDEIHRFDTVNEKISLSDRFGITITYLAPSQEEYYAIIETLARKQGVELPGAELRQEALRWELAHSGRSGRAAQQFINYLLGRPAEK